ncbi:hypothetical protein EON63_11690 [archaeon]|nr:MAG: hypothetical protein EON63_11690 [archaeon]
MKDLVQQQVDGEMLPIYNRIKIEEHEREKYQKKIQQENERLKEVQRKAQLEVGRVYGVRVYGV